MKIRCRECKTIYDDKEKYCPYCFSRTDPHDCYHLNSEGGRVEGKAMLKRKRQTKQFNYQKRATTKFKRSKPKTASTVVVVIAFLVLAYMLISFLRIFFFIVSYFFW